MRQIGKIGRRNIEANRELRDFYYENETTTCELGFKNCQVNWTLAFAHRHNRVWYRSRPELLSDINQTILACQPCHAQMDDTPGLRKKKFAELRGIETYKKDL